MAGFYEILSFSTVIQQQTPDSLQVQTSTTVQTGTNPD